MLKKVSQILSSWIIDYKIDDIECMRLLLVNGLDTEQAEYLMELVNSQAIAIVGVEYTITEHLDQSCEFDDDIDCFKTELAETLEIEYDAPCNERSPYEDYLRNESGVYA
ncbi:MAG TPA: hypothetical protein PKD16_19755 [Saprospiraceae bacterium]|nr:hypothetical protein [Saprospiraceae bacterium]